MNEAAQIEAKDLAAWLKEQGPGKLGAADWSGVAILCARKRWIDPIELALREQGLPVQNHSRREIQGDDPAFAWFTALMVVMAEPWNGYEIVGVLREIFGLSDQELYDFAKGDGKRFQIETKTGGRGPVVDVLNLLHETREKAAQLPILDAVETIIGAARLRERLNAIAGDGSITRTTPLVSKMEGEVPPEPSSGKDMEAERTLATLLSRAASAESERKPFRDWADALKKGYADTRDSPRVKENSIQLMTCHAAKGLEWDAVIIPMMFRPIGRRGSQYPYVYRDRRKGSTVLVFSPEWLAEEADRHIKLAQKQEDQRLLYVAMTRAKKTLVLADDAAISSRTKDSFAECMELTGKKQPETWTALPRQISIQPGAEEEAPAVERIEPIKSLSKQDLAAATKRAHDFPRRILPSALVVHAADAEPEQAWDIDPDWETGADEAGRRYGTWWHGVMEKLDWRNAEAWNAVFEEEILSSPFPDRARKEWALFVNSDIAKTLARPELVIQTEVPFLRKLPDGGCEEGFIDLVACNPVKNEWLVIDWKTNEIRESQLPELRKLYEPQIKEYAAAILSFAGPTASVKALLYSTPRGKTI